MNMKLLGAAVAAALLGLSTASFGQGSGASSQDTPREAAAGTAGPGSAISGSTSGTPQGSSVPSSQDSPGSSGSATATNCDTLSGAAKTRCIREQGASRGSSSPSAPLGQSGPGASDKTDSKNPGVGTSSAGSSN